MASPDPQLLATVASYQAATNTIRSQVLTFLRTLWRSLGSYHDQEAERFVRGILPVILGAEKHMSALTSGYLAQVRRLGTGEVSKALLADPNAVTGSATRNGTDPSVVYERPFNQIWIDWAKGVDPQTAIDRGLARAESLAVTDLQRTKALASQNVLNQDSRAVGFTRVLEGAYSCGLCIVASTARYHKDDLLPIHPACDCSVAPIYGDTDPGHLVNLGLLQDVHASIEQFFGVSNPSADGYRDLIITHEHGELGKVLARRGDHFTGPADIPA